VSIAIGPSLTLLHRRTHATVFASFSALFSECLDSRATAGVRESAFANDRLAWCLWEPMISITLTRVDRPTSAKTCRSRSSVRDHDARVAKVLSQLLAMLTIQRHGRFSHASELAGVGTANG
jgi:hypothetical protein